MISRILRIFSVENHGPKDGSPPARWSSSRSPMWTARYRLPDDLLPLPLTIFSHSEKGKKKCLMEFFIFHVRFFLQKCLSRNDRRVYFKRHGERSKLGNSSGVFLPLLFGSSPSGQACLSDQRLETLSLLPLLIPPSLYLE